MEGDKNEVDPFDIFGDDSSDDDEISDTNGEEAISAAAKLREHMVQTANERHTKRTDSSLEKEDAPVVVDIEVPLAMHVWGPEHDPLYLSPQVQVSSCPLGGSRQWIATSPLKPGTLLLVENPLFTWPDEQIGKSLNLSSIHHLCSLKNASQLLHAMEELHPTRSHVNAILSSPDTATPSDQDQIISMMNLMGQEHPNVEPLINECLSQHLTNKDGSPVTAQDLWRMLLALRYNGFTSGCYLHFSMLNHDGARPNCIKFMPNLQSYSEVRTTRWVQRGEMLTIHYMTPREISHATSRQHLWDQHRFDIGVSVSDPVAHQMELVNGTFPDSNRDTLDPDSPTSRIEAVLTEWEGTLEDTNLPLERLQALELAEWELCTASQQQLDNDGHILLARCRRLHLDTCEALLNASQKSNITLGNNMVWTHFVASAHALLNLQLLYLGPDHVDMARTHRDLTMGIESLLRSSHKHLHELSYILRENISPHKTIVEWSKYESQCRAEHERVSALYPRDADSHIASHEK